VPALILLVAFLVSFGVSGLLVQMVVNSLLGFVLPTWLVAMPVFLLALPQVRAVGSLLRRYAVGDETEAVKRSSFIGKVAVVTVGVASRGSPAEARFSDEYGTSHYVMVEPDSEQVFAKGEQVLLVEERGATFLVISPANANLTNNNDMEQVQ
jgi:Inner membrane protein YqiJ, OB-fold/Inner membrane protein YqiJ, N-terminal